MNSDISYGFPVLSSRLSADIFLVVPFIPFVFLLVNLFFRQKSSPLTENPKEKLFFEVNSSDRQSLNTTEISESQKSTNKN